MTYWLAERVNFCWSCHIVDPGNASASKKDAYWSVRHQAPLLTQITKIKTLEIILQGLEAANLSCFPDHPLQTWYLSKPHKHIWVNCCPVWIFTELTQKIWHFDRFTRTSGIFTDLTQKVNAFDTNTLFYNVYRVDSSCFVVFMFMFILFYHVH